MATEAADERRQHLRAVTVTALAGLFGVAAAFISAFLTADLSATAAAKDQTAQLVVAVAILVQIPLVQQSGFYDSEEFGAKLVLFIAFMTFSMWFVTWGILLQTGWSF